MSAQLSGLVAALEGAWDGIRERHPEVPEAAIVVASGARPGGKTLKYGHWCAGAWHSEQEEATAEVLIGGEGLARGPVEVLGTLIHEATHGLADARGIQDVSPSNPRYHNAKFRDLAGEMGITITRNDRIGWSITEVPRATAEEYASELHVVQAALSAVRLKVGPRRPPKKPPTPPAECSCGRSVRVSRRALDAGPITCGLCDTDFVIPKRPAP